MPGLCWGRGWGSGSSCNSAAQPANTPLSLHMHDTCVLPFADPTVYHVPVNAAHTGHPLAASFGRQVSLTNKRINIQIEHEKFPNWKMYKSDVVHKIFSIKKQTWESWCFSLV